MKDYVTISVPREVKADLEKMRKGREWGEFLLDLSNEAKRLKSMRAFGKLSALLSEEELGRIDESSKDLREGLKLR